MHPGRRNSLPVNPDFSSGLWQGLNLNRPGQDNSTWTVHLERMEEGRLPKNAEAMNSHSVGKGADCNHAGRTA